MNTRVDRTKTKAKRLIFMAGNYASRIDGAVYLQIGDDILYFHESHVIGIRSGGTIYRVEYDASGHRGTMVIRRIRQAMQRHSAKVIKDVTRQELRDMAEAILMRTAVKLVDQRLGIQSEK